MSELTEKIQKEMDVWEDLREYGIFEGVGIAKEIIEEHELQHEIKLNDNQKIVLEWLKEETIDRGNPYAGIYWLLENDEYPNMSNKEFYQALAAFAEWGMEQEEF